MNCVTKKTATTTKIEEIKPYQDKTLDSYDECEFKSHKFHIKFEINKKVWTNFKYRQQIKYPLTLTNKLFDF